MPFPRVLVLCEMQTTSFRTWTRVTVSISYNDKCYITSTSLFFMVTLIIKKIDDIDFGSHWVFCTSAFFFCCLLWSRGGSNDNTTRKWVIRNIVKENSTYINDSREKPLLSLTQSWILPFLVTDRRDCAEESLAGICHMRASPSVGETPQHC